MSTEHAESRVPVSQNRATDISRHMGLGLIALFALIGTAGYLLRTTHGFSMVPGDLGDARFNSVILEHFFRWLQGSAKSLWSPDFFYPYHDALAFSDNHFGTAWIYALARFAGLSRELAFDTWFCAGFLLSYFCCAYAARKFGFSWLASAVAAFVFAFSPPILAQELHAQLIYRYAIPLAMLNLWQILQFRRLDRLSWLAIWVAVQFFCSIYLGLFTVMLASAVIFSSIYVKNFSLAQSTWIPTGRPSPSQIFTSVVAILTWVGLVLMLGKYHSVAKEYGFHRDVGEISSMLPRIGSYFIADNFKLDAWVGHFVTHVPMRHEHQMFFGLGASLLAIIGLLTARKSPRWHQPARILTLALLVLVLVTLSVGHFSLYRAIMLLPGFNSIRAVTRICLVMLLPVAGLGAMGIEALAGYVRNRLILTLTVAALLSAELLSYAPYHVPIEQWEARLTSLRDGSKFSPNEQTPILFALSNPNTPWPNLITELDAMMLAQDMNVPTVNGYSGNLPNDFGSADTCMTAASRLTNATAFERLPPAVLAGLLRRLTVLPANTNCPDFASLKPYQGALADSVFHHVSIAIVDLKPEGSDYLVTIEIRNDSQDYLPALSTSDQPVQLSWQFVPVGQPPSNNAWNTRAPLEADIPAGSSYRQTIRVQPPVETGHYALAFSLVQDKVAWFHDKGMSIAIGNTPIDVGGAPD